MKRPKLWLPIFILLAGVAGVALLWLSRPTVKAKAPETLAPLVEVVVVAPEEIRFVVRTQGTVEPRTESDLIPQVSGKVVWLSPALATGGAFEAGEPLLRIESTDYDLELESARAALARTRSQHGLAKKDFARQRVLAEQEVTSQARIDDAESAARVASAALRESQARVARAERDLERTEIEAPFAGRVREERVDVGQFVSRGQAVATLYAVDQAEVRLPLPDRELAFLDLPLARGAAASDGAGAEVTLHAEFAGQQRSWTGRVVRTEGEIDARSRMVHVVAEVEDPYGRKTAASGPPLAVGLFVQAEILGRSQAGAVVLPRAALRDATHVAVVDAESRLRFRAVEVMRIEGERVVIGSGLAAGERVCVSPLPGAVDGMAVRVADSAGELAGTGP